MKVLSFDCGHESLGISIIEFIPKHLITINTMLTDELIDAISLINELNRLSEDEKQKLLKHISEKLSQIIKEFESTINVDIAASVQLLEGNIRGVGILERAASIKSFLTRVNTYCPNPDIVLIEDQTINNLSGEIAVQIAFFYSNIQLHKQASIFPHHVSDKLRVVKHSQLQHRQPKIVIMHPKYKNYLRFAKHMGIEQFYAKYVGLYEANKNHTKSNFIHWMTVMSDDESYTCKYSAKNKTGIQSKRKRDMADAFMQAIAYFVFMICKS